MIKCPYCGVEQYNEGLYNQTPKEWTCGACKEASFVSEHTTIIYQAVTKAEHEEMQDPNYVPF